MEDQEAKERILKGSEKLFMKYGVRSISMDDIARHLSVSKKTLYQHFADKDELVLMVSKAHLKQEKQRYDEITSDSVNAIDELHKISFCLRKDMQEMNPSLLFDIEKFYPKAWEVYLDFKNKFVRQSIVKNIKLGIEEGYFRPDLSPEIITTLRLATVEATFDDRIFPKDKFNFVEVHTQLFEHFVYGLCTDKGRKLYQKYKETNHQPQLNSQIL
jgi:TetR/AcrR family transcriptional regulator, cholesterol catabolism regulator